MRSIFTAIVAIVGLVLTVMTATGWASAHERGGPPGPAIGKATKDASDKASLASLPGAKMVGYAASVGAAIDLGSLTLFPIYAVSDPHLDDAVSLELALERGTARVRELGSEDDPSAGTVGTLVIENLGKSAVFVLAGTVVQGGKQDRQIGQDFVIAPKQTVDVQAFCVEHGRWTEKREGKSTGGSFSASGMLAPSAVRVAGQYENDQSKVWDEVAQTNEKSKKSSASGTLMATYDDEEVRREREKLAERAAAELAKAPSPEAVLGIAYAVGGEIRNVRWFANRSLFEQHRDKLLQTAAVEARLSTEGKKNKAVTAKMVRDFVDDVAKSAVLETKKADKAMNRNHYKKAKRAFAAEARLEAEEGAAPSPPMTVDVSAH